MGSERVQTVELKSVCNKFSNIIKLNPIRPVTDLVELYCRDGVLRMGSTDNITRIVATLDNEIDFGNVVVSLSQLTKLARLTTKDEIKLTKKEDYLEFKGNGKYKLPILLDEMGNKLSLNLYMPPLKDGKEYKHSDLADLLTRDNITLYTGDMNECLNRFYCYKDYVVTTDGISIGAVKSTLPVDELYPSTVEQLVNLEDDFTFSEVEEGYRVSSDNIDMFIMIYKTHDFPIDSVKPFIEHDSLFTVSFNTSKNDFLGALKRIAVFNKCIGIPAVNLTFSNNCVNICNTDNTAEESIECKSNSTENISITVSTDSLILLSRKMESNFSVRLGNMALCLEDTKGFYILSILEED